MLTYHLERVTGPGYDMLGHPAEHCACCRNGMTRGNGHDAHYVIYVGDSDGVPVALPTPVCQNCAPYLSTPIVRMLMARAVAQWEQAMSMLDSWRQAAEIVRGLTDENGNAHT
jgi:hypothetical protein